MLTDISFLKYTSISSTYRECNSFIYFAYCSILFFCTRTAIRFTQANGCYFCTYENISHLITQMELNKIQHTRMKTCVYLFNRMITASRNQNPIDCDGNSFTAVIITAITVIAIFVNIMEDYCQKYNFSIYFQRL